MVTYHTKAVDNQATTESADEVATREETHIIVPSMVIDPSNAGGPFTVVGPDIVITHVATPEHQPLVMEEDEPWKVKTRKSKGKHVPF